MNYREVDLEQDQEQEPAKDIFIIDNRESEVTQEVWQGESEGGAEGGAEGAP